MRPVRAVLAGALFAILPTCILAQSLPSVNTIIQPDGTVKALYESQAVVTGQFWDFRENWNRVTEWTSTGNGSSTFSRAGQIYPGVINVATQFSNASGGTNLTFNATPTRTLQSNSDHVNFMLDDAFWAGATLTDGSQSIYLNPNFTQGFARTGWSSVVTVTRPDGFKVTFTAPSNVNFVIKDSRDTNYGFELRFDERNGTWSSGATRTYQVNMKFSNSVNTVPDAPVVISESSEWRQVLQSMTIQAGSALDWSDKFAPAAGSQGWLKVNTNGKFAFESNMNAPRKFYGANLAHYACFPTHVEADQMVENLSRAGYNTVRLHHIDYVLTGTTTANSTTFDADWLDRLNYLVAKLKAKGIYVSIDLHSLRTPRDNEVISGGISANDFKALLLVSPAARNNWLAYATKLMNTQNPYTGLKWKEDPAIAWICLVNENTPFWLQQPRADIKAMLDTAVGGDWSNMTGQGARNAVELTRQTAAWMAAQLRNIGVKSLISNMNAGFNRALSIGRADLDYVDNHTYFAHPDGFGTPVTQKSTSPLRKVEEYGWFGVSRIKGKPFTVSEFDGVAPNQFRAEYGLMIGAMSVVQQWDGMWRFQWADNMFRATGVNPLSLFSLTTDPLNMATERAIVAMFLRGDLTNNDAPYTVANALSTSNENEIREEPVVVQSILAKPIAQDITGNSSGGSYVNNGNSSTSSGDVIADLNQLTLKVKTTCTAGVIGSEGQTVNSGPLAAKFTKTRSTIYLSSVDRRPLSTSRRMLLAHLTDVQNSGATFSGQERGTLTSWGSLPHLAKVGTAEVTVAVQNPAIMRVYRLDLSGRRTGNVNFTKQSKSIKFNVTTRDPSTGGAVLYYEIVTTK